MLIVHPPEISRSLQPIFQRRTFLFLRRPSHSSTPTKAPTTDHRPKELTLTLTLTPKPKTHDIHPFRLHFLSEKIHKVALHLLSSYEVYSLLLIFLFLSYQASYPTILVLVALPFPFHLRGFVLGIYLLSSWRDKLRRERKEFRLCCIALPASTLANRTTKTNFTHSFRCFSLTIGSRKL
jgi:hypothetical protein